MKDDLAKDQGGFGGLHNVLVHVGRDPWGSRAPLTSTRLRSASKDLVATVIQGKDSRAVPEDPLAWICLGYCAFHDQNVCAALVDLKAYRLGPRGDHFIGASSKTAF